VPVTVKSHFLAISRIEQRVTKRLPLVLAGACLEVSAGAAGAATGGSRGAAVGWLFALSAEALAMWPVIGRRVRLAPASVT
jgi:hypothetical protein